MNLDEICSEIRRNPFDSSQLVIEWIAARVHADIDPEVMVGEIETVTDVYLATQGD